MITNGFFSGAFWARPIVGWTASPAPEQRADHRRPARLRALLSQSVACGNKKKRLHTVRLSSLVSGRQAKSEEPASPTPARGTVPYIEPPYNTETICACGTRRCDPFHVTAGLHAQGLVVPVRPRASHPFRFCPPAPTSTVGSSHWPRAGEHPWTFLF